MQQEQEEHANKPLSDSHDEDSVVEEKPKNQSIAQVIYAENRVRIFQKLTIFKVEKIFKGSLDSIPSPSPSVKIQIMGGKVCLRCKGKTLLVVVNKLLKEKSNVLPYYRK